MECHTTNIETEEVLRLVADEDRRHVIAALVDHPENVMSLGDLAGQVDVGPSPSATGPQLADRSRAALHHDHLPRLDDAGLIEFDTRSDTVRYYPDDRVERLVEFVRTDLE